MEEHYNNEQYGDTRAEQGEMSDSEQKPARPVRWKVQAGGQGRVLVARKGGYDGLLRRNFVVDRDASDEFHNALIGSASMGA